jgi:diguanylate cyclase (GGDEF)-like protein
MIATSWGNIVKKPTDLAARIGGEEFAIISPDTQPDQILESLQHFLLLLQERPIPHGTSAVASHVTMSIGVAGCVPQRGASPNDLFVAADQHLYTAKHAGRNCIIVE